MSIQFNSKTSIITINAANPNLNGTGVIVSLATGAPTFGTMLGTVRIQAIGNTVLDVVRFFVK